MKTLFTTLSFAFCATLVVQAQTGNEFQGLNSGINITTGSFNSLYGDFSGRDLTTSQYNTFIGYASGIFVNGSSTAITARNTGIGALTLRQVASGDDNTAIGYTAGYTITSGDYNVLNGSRAGFLLTTGSDNVAIGFESGYSMTSGNDNVFNGFRTGYFATTAFDNSFTGNGAGFNASTGNRNVFFGNLAGSNVTTGSENVSLGSRSGGALSTVTSSTTATTSGATGDENVSIGESANRLLTTGYSNTTVGHDAGFDITTGHHNVIMGDSAGIDIGLASANTFIGAGAGSSTENAGFNTFVGYYSGKRNNVSNANISTNAYRNTFLGAFSGDANEEGADNIAIGYDADFAADGTSQSIVLGTNATIGSNTLDLTGPIAIGFESSADANYATSLGHRAEALQSYSMALGANAVASNPNSMVIGGLTATDRMSVGIGTTFPNLNASLDLSETDHGFLISRMTTAQESAFSSTLSTIEEGMMIFNTTEDVLKIWDGSQWINSEDQDLSLTGNTLALSGDNTTVDLSAYLDNTDTQLSEAQVDAFVANNGYLTNFSEVDGDITNELQTVALSGNNLSISSGNTVNLSQFLDNTDTQLTEAQVDAFVANNGYLANFTEVDGDVTNEIQDLSISGNTLSLTDDATTVDLSPYLDNTDTQLTEAQVDAFIANNGYLTNFVEADGDITNELQDISLNGNNLTISSGSTVDLSTVTNNTDEQDLTSATLTGTILEIEIENGASVSVDLSPLLADLQNQINLIDDRLIIIEDCACDSTTNVGTNGPIESAILYQNIPNPFNATSSIKYYIPTWANSAELVFSNDLGQLVSQMSLEEKGDYGTAHISAQDLTTGVYFYSLYINQTLIDTKKMIVE